MGKQITHPPFVCPKYRLNLVWYGGERENNGVNGREWRRLIRRSKSRFPGHWAPPRDISRNSWMISLWTVEVQDTCFQMYVAASRY